MSSLIAPREDFTEDEKKILTRYFTNIDLPVFGLRNLPEVVKGALFARYSRSAKSIRRLFLDEFYQRADGVEVPCVIRGSESDAESATQRAEQLYDRIFNQYGDDSVAQLGGAHIACENASNVLTKILERGRLAAYLEQSTRYIRYDRKVDGRYRYATPPELKGWSHLKEYVSVMELLFDTYSCLVADLIPWLERRFPQAPHDSTAVWRSTINAKACDIARGLLPASTVANLGIFATGQAFEMLLMRMFAHELEEVREYATLILVELRKLIPSFMRRVDQEARGTDWSHYFSQVRTSMTASVSSMEIPVSLADEVTLIDWERDAEDKIISAALYEHTHAPDSVLASFVKTLSERDKDQIFSCYVGDRRNRRHKPGRAFERVGYRFDILSDYGAFRDLQRHRMLTIEWQKLTTAHGYVVPLELREMGAHEEAWHHAMKEAERLHANIASDFDEQVAQYAVPFAYRVRFVMQMNAREAVHLIELRSQRQGHPSYRRICQQMHRKINDIAGHRRIASAMKFVDYEEYDLERLDAERRAEKRLLKPEASASL